MTLNDLERPKRKSGRKDASFAAHCTNLMKIDPHMQRQKCRPMTLVSGNIRYVRTLAGVPLGGDLK